MLPNSEGQRRAEPQAGCIQEGIVFLVGKADKAATLDGVNDTVEEEPMTKTSQEFRQKMGGDSIR